MRGATDDVHDDDLEMTVEELIGGLESVYGPPKDYLPVSREMVYRKPERYKRCGLSSIGRS